MPKAPGDTKWQYFKPSIATAPCWYALNSVVSWNQLQLPLILCLGYVKKHVPMAWKRFTIDSNWCKPKLESGKTDRKKKYFNWHACTRWLNCNELSTSCPVKMGPILLACGSPRAWITFRSQFYLWWKVGSPYSSGKSVNRIIKCCKSELDQTGFCNLASCIADQLQLFCLQAQWEAGRGDLMR